MKLSIRTRLTVTFLLTFAALLILFTGVVYSILSSSLSKKLREDSRHDMAVMLQNLTSAQWRNEIDELPDESEEFRLLIKVFDSDGRVIKRAGQAPFSGWPDEFDEVKSSLTGPFWSKIEIDNTPYLVLTQSFTPPGQLPHFVQIANSEADIRWIEEKFTHCINIGTPIVLLLAGFSGYLFSRRALAPVARISERAEHITSSNLHERIEYDGPRDELRHLTDTLNGMLSRIQNTVDQMRRFIADASHEMRIPLTGIRGTLEVTLRKERPAEEYRKAIKTAYGESERMSELVWDLLSLARLDSGHIEIEKTSVNLSQLLHNVLEEAKALNADNKVAIQLREAPSVVTRLDEAKVHQLLLNLIENAIKYNKPGGDVFISAAASPKNISISVKDTGVGIAEEDLPKIFERFYRVDKARSRGEGGSGLGLSIARSIAEAHNGSLTVKSVLGQGSEFTLTLPV